MEYILKSSHPHAEDLHDGRIVGPGDRIKLTKEDAADPHNARLIEEEFLIPVQDKKSEGDKS